MPYYLLSDFSHWRQRAAEFRSLAATVEGDEAKEALLRTALHYDRLAKAAEERPEPPRPVSAPKPQVRLSEIANRSPVYSLKQVPFAPLNAPVRPPADPPINLFAGITGRSDLK